MKLIQELNESRLFRRLKQLSSKTADDLAERLFEHLLALQIISNENLRYAKQYTDEIMKYQNFDGFRTSQNDLYNLISVLLNQDKYSYVFDPNPALIIPEMRLRRNLRNLANGKLDNSDYSQLMMMLQRRFEKLGGQHIQMRRQISDWKNLHPNDKKSIITRMLINMRERGVQSDLYVQLERLSKDLAK